MDDKDESSAAGSASSQEFAGALHDVLAPLVRLMLAKNVTYPALADLLKSVFVDVAEGEIRASGDRVSHSRVSLATGVHRKDVRRLREERTPPREGPPGSLAAHIVAVWTSEPEYLDDAGHPKPLPRRSVATDGPSFDSLVESVSTDIRPRAVLDELLYQNVASIGGDDTVALNLEAFVPSRGFDEKLPFFRRNARDHLATLTNNLLEAGPPLLERSVYYDGLSKEDVAELEALARDQGMALLQSINRLAARLADETELSAGEARHRFNFGLYFFEDEDESGGNGSDQA